MNHLSSMFNECNTLIELMYFLACVIHFCFIVTILPIDNFLTRELRIIFYTWNNLIFKCLYGILDLVKILFIFFQHLNCIARVFPFSTNSIFYLECLFFHREIAN